MEFREHVTHRGLKFPSRASHRVCRSTLLLASVVVSLAAEISFGGEEPSPQALEYRVKAGFLYNFAKHVQWPATTFASSTNAIVIGILGEDPFGKMLDTTVAGKTIDGHPISVERFERVEDIKACHILFTSASEKDRLADIQKNLGGRNILTVSDMDGFLTRGGQIQFITEDNRVKFDIGLDTARQAGLRLDSNLLRLARRVIRQKSNTGAD